MSIRSGALAIAGLMLFVTAASAESVTVQYEAEVETVVDEPFGLTVPLNTVVTGHFTFDTSTPDSDADPGDGVFVHDGDSAFTAEFLGHRVDGSGTAYYWIDEADTSFDTFRIIDGPRSVGAEGGVMSFDGSEDEDIQLLVALSEDVFEDDTFLNPFPLFDFGFLGTPHTFSLKDDQGTMLLQIRSISMLACGDPTGGGISASDALFVLRTAVGQRECEACLCNTDGNGNVTATDALLTLKAAVNPSIELHCPACG